MNTQLANGNFDSAIMTGVDLSFANLTDANLCNADITSGVTANTIWTGAVYDELTVFPSGSTFDVAPWDLDGGISPWDAGMIPVPEPSGTSGLIAGSLALVSLMRRRLAGQG